MGLIALIFSVVIDAVWPLRGRPQDFSFEAGVRDPVAAGATADPEAADPLADPPYDPLTDPLPDPLSGTPLPADPLTADPLSAEPPRKAAGYTTHPLLRHALRLIDWVAVDTAAARDGRRAVPRTVTAPGWLVVVGLPVVLVALAQWLLGAVTGFFVFLLHVAVLYLAVGLGAFHRQFSELQLLVGAGEEDSARVVLSRWIGAGGAPIVLPRRTVAGGQPADGSAPTLASAAAGHAVLAAYRDVFAPLLWYLVLPGAIGPVFYLFARFAACHSWPFARTAYEWIDWIPLRLLSLIFALVGRFEDTMYALRAVSPIRPAAGSDPYLHQRLVLLPVAGGALGLRLADAGVDDHLRRQAPDLDLPGGEPEAASLRPVSGLLLRAGVVAAGAWLLVVLLR